MSLADHVVSFIGNMSTVACMNDRRGKLLAILLPFSLIGFFSLALWSCTAVGLKLARNVVTSGKTDVLVAGFSSESNSSFSFSSAAKRARQESEYCVKATSMEAGTCKKLELEEYTRMIHHTVYSHNIQLASPARNYCHDSPSRTTSQSRGKNQDIREC